MTIQEDMTAEEKRAAGSVASLYLFRMLGLFMIMPVFALYAEGMPDYTPVLAGLAIGAYGLTQAMLQIPFGLLSDRIGRKKVILMGLLIFIAGSVVCAFATNLVWMVIGRALQGAGAISSTLMALAADLSREEHRSKMMASIGASIGVSFTVALVLGPILEHWVGVPGIFVFTAVLGFIGIAITYRVIPTPKAIVVHRDAEPVIEDLKRVCKNAELLRLDFGILILHMMMTALFVVVPLVLRDHLGPEASTHVWVYLLVMGVAFVLMLPFMIIGEKKQKLKPVFLGAIALLVVAELAFWQWSANLWGAIGALLLFFTAFNLLEATLPSLVSKQCPADCKGSAMGVYASAQFLGAFLGGLMGGILYAYGEAPAVFMACAVLCFVWLLVAWPMQSPKYARHFLLKVGQLDAHKAKQLAKELMQVSGVKEAVIRVEDGVAYLRVDSALFDPNRLEPYRAS